MPPKQPDLAVLTGDLVASTKAGADAVDAAMDTLAHAAAEIEGWHVGGPTRFTRYRGDGWQIILDRPALALRAALFLTARLRAADAALATRIAIGIGPVESRGTVSLADAGGAAFQASGRAVDAMKRQARITIDGEGVTDFQRVIVDLLSERARRWTREQAEAMGLALHPDQPTLSDLASRLGITPQAVNYRLGGAGATEIRRALRVWEDADERDGNRGDDRG